MESALRMECNKSRIFPGCAGDPGDCAPSYRDTRYTASRETEPWSREEVETHYQLLGR